MYVFLGGRMYKARGSDVRARGSDVRSLGGSDVRG